MTKHQMKEAENGHLKISEKETAHSTDSSLEWVTNESWVLKYG